MKKIIYIMEKQEILASAYEKTFIAEFGNFVKIKKFTSEEEILNSMKIAEPDLIISDLTRIKGNTIEFVKKLDSKRDNKKTKIIILSAVTSLYVGSLFYMADDFLEKPIMPYNLIKRVSFFLFYNEHIKNNDNINYIFDKMCNLNHIIKSINFKFNFKYGITEFINSHDSNNLDIFQIPKTKEELTFYFSVVASFFERIDIGPNHINNSNGSLNRAEYFLKENNIKINFLDLRDIKKLRNTYPNHLSDKDLFYIYKKWGIKDIKDYEQIGMISLKKIINFLEELDKKI